MAVTVFDVVQRRDPIWRNFPVVGHFRKVMTSAGPKLRQYIVADNDEERPFSRDQRRWVHDTATEGTPTSASAPTTTSTVAAT